MTKIDGSFGEGGGQILRTSLTLSAVYNKPVLIENIRAKRSKPGLRPQHVTCVQALAKITRAKIEGAETGSKSLSFYPSGIYSGDYLFDVAEKERSAGSVSLIFQTLLLPLALGGGTSRVVIRGGTHVPWSPPFHYLSEVFMPTVSKMGISSTLRIIRWGWYPEGGGEVEVVINPIEGLRAVSFLERVESPTIKVMCVSSNLPSHIAERERGRIENCLKQLGLEAQFHTSDVPARGQGNFVFLRVKDKGVVAGFSSLGKRGKRAERVADEVVHDLFRFLETGASIDSHLADQLVPYMALAEGSCSIHTERITPHLLTNVWVIQRFLDISFQVEGSEGEKGRVAKAT
jgi:RNA 3'-terminal phosphate cyclase (ATP)